jgi:hypothetical protein
MTHLLPLPACTPTLTCNVQPTSLAFVWLISGLALASVHIELLAPRGCSQIFGNLCGGCGLLPSHTRKHRGVLLAGSSIKVVNIYKPSCSIIDICLAVAIVFLSVLDIVCESSIEVYGNKTYLTFYTEISSSSRI